jgi:hypothetical protein
VTEEGKEDEDEEEGRRGGNRKQKESWGENMNYFLWISSWTDWKLREQNIYYISDSNFRSTCEIIAYLYL